MSKVVLYDYWRSTASYRVRIALNLAGIAYESVPINLIKGEQRAKEHIARNAQGFVPVLEIDGLRLTQSLSIIEYLNETHELGLLPSDPATRAKARALAQIIACDTHPVCNLSVVGFAIKSSNDLEADRLAWMQHFIRLGLEAFEYQLIADAAPPLSETSTPTMADICLIPQLYNAKRWSVSYDYLNRIKAIEKFYSNHQAFNAAVPTNPKD